MLTEQEYIEAYHAYFRPLCFMAVKYTKSGQEAENIVQESFIKLWERREQTDRFTVKSFLYLMTANACKNYARHLSVVAKSEVEISYLADRASEEVNAVYFEYVTLLYDSIECMPEKRKAVFKAQLQQEGKLNLPKLANELGISYYTLKEHKVQGYKYLRNLFKIKFPHLFG
jgi:RNA polymerase sigma factor (sigma-70 family)